MASVPRRLPSLQALHVFEACARLESFTAAARELCVTQAAVSARIRKLEADLGAPLFVRERPLRLSAVGEQLWQEVSRGLNVIREGIEATLSRRKLRVSCTPTFAAAWLAPRLGAWCADAARSLLEIDASTDVRGLGDGTFDLCIRSGFGRWPRALSHRLFEIDRTPMLSPALCRAWSGRSLEAFLRLPLLADTHWERWIAAAGGADAAPLRFVASLPSQDLAARAAVAGAGAALLSRRLFEPLLASGELVAPFETAIRGPDAYYLLWPEAGSSADAGALRDWIVRQFEGDS